jgi:hypothetical protein
MIALARLPHYNNYAFFILVIQLCIALKSFIEPFKILCAHLRCTALFLQN